MAGRRPAAGVPRGAALLAALLLTALLLVPSAPGGGSPREIHLSWQQPSVGHVTATWVTDTPSPGSQARYGRTPALEAGYVKAVTGPVPNLPSLYLHRAVLGPLVAGITYYYSVGDNGTGWSPLLSFTSAPLDPAPFRFAATADMGVNSVAAANVARMAALQPAFVLHAGDLSYANGDQGKWDTWFGEIEPLASRTAYLPAIGNHEYEAGYGLSAYLGRFALPNGERWYSFNYSSAHVVVLDGGACYTCGLPAGELPWLERDLAYNAGDPLHPWTIAVFHFPPFNAGSHGSWLAGRSALSPLFDRYGVELVINGHDHNYQRTWPVWANGTVAQRDYEGLRAPVYFVTGGGGAPLHALTSAPAWSAFRQQAYETLRITIEGNTALVEAVRPDGSLLDRVVITRAPPAGTATLGVEVRYPDATPVPWAWVEVWEGYPWAPGSTRLLGTSNALATYAIDLPLGGTYWVRAWGDGETGYLGQRSVNLTANTTLKFLDPTKPGVATVNLTIGVRYPEGSVVAWGWVEVWEGYPWAPGSTRLFGASGVDSTYRVAVPLGGTYWVRAWGDGGTGYIGETTVTPLADATVVFVDPTNPYLLSPRVEVFYYPWYGNPATDGRWIHWNEGGHGPPDDIASAFYPALGAYSTADPRPLRLELQWIRETGAGVLVYSWWGPGSLEDRRLPLVLDEAARFGLKVAIHAEPGAYFTSPADALAALAALQATYASHPAFLDRFHIFGALRFPLEAWRAALAARHPGTLLAQTTDATWMEVFDGLYQYDGSSRLSTAAWAPLAARARALGKLFLPNVAPGYNETRAAGGRGYLTADREGGARYDRLWAAALAAGVDAIGITSFNEWHEGTQIAPAIPKAIPGYTYGNYGDLGPLYYIGRTLYWVTRFTSP